VPNTNCNKFIYHRLTEYPFESTAEQQVRQVHRSPLNQDETGDRAMQRRIRSIAVSEVVAGDEGVDRLNSSNLMVIY
jgi:hypothetical protein